MGCRAASSDSNRRKDGKFVRPIDLMRAHRPPSLDPHSLTSSLLISSVLQWTYSKCCARDAGGRFTPQPCQPVLYSIKLVITDSKASGAARLVAVSRSDMITAPDKWLSVTGRPPLGVDNIWVCVISA